MTDLTGKKIANTYKDLLQINSSASNEGVDGTLRRVQDGGGTNTAISLSQNKVQIHGDIEIDGALSLTSLQVNGLNANEVNSTLIQATSASITYLNATNLIFQDVSVSSLRTGNLFATTISATDISATTINATSILVAGVSLITASAVSELSATLQTEIDAVSAALVSTSNVLTTNINIALAAVSTANVSIAANSSAISVLETSVAANASAISDIKTSLSNYLPLSGGTMAGNLSMNLNTLTVPYMDIKASGTQTVFEGSGTTGVRVVADATFEIKGANRLKTMFTGGELGNTTLYYNPTAINDPAIPRIRTQVSGTTLYGDVSITGDAYVSGTIFQAGVTVANTSLITALSATLESRIATVSSTLQTDIDANTSAIAVANTSIAANASAVVALSATLESRIATVSSTLQTSIDANASAIVVANASIAANTSLITALSATLESRIAGVSSTFAATSATLEGRIATVSSTMATSIANHLPLAGGTMTGFITLNAEPTADLHAATKLYVDNLASGAIHFHEAVRLEAPYELSATYSNGTDGVGATLTNAGTQAILVVDGVTVVPNDRILIYEQTDQTTNGVYVATTIGSPSTNWVLTRASDADTAGDGSPDSLDSGSYFFVSEGDTGAGESYVCNVTTSIVFGTTNITFVQFSSAIQYTAGTNINISGDRIISTSGVPTNADLAAVSATLATSIANVSATLESRIATVSSTLQSSIDANTSSIVVANASIAANTSLITALSATLETRIATVSSTLQTSIDANTSAIAVANTSIAANASAIAVANTSIAANASAIAVANVSIAANASAIAVLQTSVAANTSLITALSATLETRIATVSSTLQTSIDSNTSSITVVSNTVSALEVRVSAVSAVAAAADPGAAVAFAIALG
jgi:hypothetical protein